MIFDDHDCDYDVVDYQLSISNYYDKLIINDHDVDDYHDCCDQDDLDVDVCTDSRTFFIFDFIPYLICYLVKGARSLSAPLTKKVIAKDCATVQTVKDRLILFNLDNFNIIDSAGEGES